jgi:error-prone DNA polymerase
VITRGKLTELCPILNARMENRTCIEWNKDDIEALGFLKIDVLALGMLTCIRKAFELARSSYGLNLTLANIPQDDPEVYDMICKADTIGVFQIESRAQQSMLPRLRPRCFYDLVIEVAIVRPGPIQGDMVHPYLKRRNGEEPVSFPSKELEQILGRTLGVPLFQEQAMKIAIVAADFTPSEADGLRRSMATFKAKGLVSKFHEKLINGMTSRGYEHDYAERVFKQLEGFGSYGFPESHAASFAQLVYISSWIKCHYPEIFACALLNSMPMGFYQPAQIIIDASRHGVVLLG